MINIETMTYDSLCKLMAEHPRLLAKFIQLVRDELQDGTLTEADIEMASNGNYDDSANSA